MTKLERHDERENRAMSVLRTAARLSVFYAAVCSFGLASLVFAFRLKLFAGIDIMFYRGLLLIGLAALVTFCGALVLIHRLSPAGIGARDAFSASVLSLALNLSFFVIVPVTVDRSISIFMLGAMAAHPDEVLTPAQASAIFKAVYVDGYGQIARRLHEQAVSGNLDQVDGGYRINRRGLAVIATAKVMAWLFDSRAGLVAPRIVTVPSGGLGGKRASGQP